MRGEIPIRLRRRRKNRITVETKSGIRGIDIANGLFTVDMGRVSFDSSTFSRVSEAVETPFVFDRERIVTLANAGNPHCVTFVPRTDTVSVGRIGRIMCRSDLFRTERTSNSWKFSAETK
ncbi:MAG: hypothetical protein ACLUSP_00650 [Christensenellales bacterium]